MPRDFDFDRPRRSRRKTSGNKPSGHLFGVALGVIVGIIVSGLILYVLLSGGSGKHESSKVKNDPSDRADREYVKLAIVAPDGKFDASKRSGNKFQANAIVVRSSNFGDFSTVLVSTDTGVQLYLWGNNHDGHAPGETARIKIWIDMSPGPQPHGQFDGKIVRWERRGD